MDLESYFTWLEETCLRLRISSAMAFLDMPSYADEGCERRNASIPSPITNTTISAKVCELDEGFWSEGKIKGRIVGCFDGPASALLCVRRGRGVGEGGGRRRAFLTLAGVSGTLSEWL